MLPSDPSPFEDSTLSSADSPFADSTPTSPVRSSPFQRPTVKQPGAPTMGLRVVSVLFTLFIVVCGVGIGIDSYNQDSGARHYNAGLKLQKAGDSRGAIAEYSKSIDLETKPKYKADAYINRGLIYFRNKQQDKAFSDFTSAIALDNTQDAPYYDLGLIYFDKGNYPEALKNFDKSAQLNPQDNDVYSERCSVYVQLKKIDLAVDQAKQLMARGNKLTSWAQDDLVDALSDQVSAKVNKYDYSGALLGMNDLIFIAPSLADSYRRRAAIYVLLKDVPHARADINKCRELGGDTGKVAPLVKDLEKR